MNIIIGFIGLCAVALLIYYVYILMKAIFKAIHEFDKRIEARAEHFAFKHPYLSFFAVFIGMPICVLAAVFFFTVIITVPIALIFGWL